MSERYIEYISEHKRIVFNGNGYSDEWLAEAERRGLPNLTSTVDAIPALITEKSIKVFTKHNVFTETELRSRAEIKFENYAKTINIEALSTLDIAKKQIVPAVMKYQSQLAKDIISLKEVGVDTSVQKEILDKITAELVKLQAAIAKLAEVTEKAATLEDDIEAQARYYHDEVFAAMQAVREPADVLEMLVAKEAWPFPSYGDLLFEV